MAKHPTVSEFLSGISMLFSSIRGLTSSPSSLWESSWEDDVVVVFVSEAPFNLSAAASPARSLNPVHHLFALLVYDAVASLVAAAVAELIFVNTRNVECPDTSLFLDALFYSVGYVVVS